MLPYKYFAFWIMPTFDTILISLFYINYGMYEKLDVILKKSTARKRPLSAISAKHRSNSTALSPVNSLCLCSNKKINQTKAKLATTFFFQLEARRNGNTLCSNYMLLRNFTSIRNNPTTSVDLIRELQ
jgi:hypothetical protein